MAYKIRKNSKNHLHTFRFHIFLIGLISCMLAIGYFFSSENTSPTHASSTHANLYSQNTITYSWSSKVYTHDNGSGTYADTCNMRSNGCGPTTLANILSKWRNPKNYTPQAVIAKYLNNKTYCDILEDDAVKVLQQKNFTIDADTYNAIAKNYRQQYNAKYNWYAYTWSNTNQVGVTPEQCSYDLSKNADKKCHLTVYELLYNTRKKGWKIWATVNRPDRVGPHHIWITYIAPPSKKHQIQANDPWGETSGGSPEKVTINEDPKTQYIAFFGFKP